MRQYSIYGLVVFLFMGCASQSAPIPVINKSPERDIPKAYEVKQGDSIYNIAWAFGVDFLDIAEFSDLEKPYKLKPGQVVYLQRREARAIALDEDEPTALVVAQELPAKEPPAQPDAPATPSAALPSVAFADTPTEWNWPAEGKLVGKYSVEKGNKGIHIAGVEGSPIKATAAGEVVYAGQGLRGYGNLVILKHSPEFLSAYAHNREILVREGQSVQTNQQIATMGNSGAQSTMLHFELRKNGQPVNPMSYLNQVQHNKSDSHHGFTFRES